MHPLPRSTCRPFRLAGEHLLYPYATDRARASPFPVPHLPGYACIAGLFVPHGKKVARQSGKGDGRVPRRSYPDSVNSSGALRWWRTVEYGSRAGLRLSVVPVRRTCCHRGLYCGAATC